MSKFRMKLKLQGLELEIEGSREDASLISRSVGQQVASLLHPASGIIEGKDVLNGLPVLEISPPLPSAPLKKARRRKQTGTASPADGERSPAVDFRHTPEKYGNPRQHWKTAEKSLWLLYVLKEAAGIGELTGPNLAKTFNKHFRQSGPIQTGHVGRDLGRLKVNETPSPVGEDTTKTPSTWFLTDQGIRRAQALVADALGQAQ